MEELLGTQDGGHLCLETALAASDAQQVATALGGAQGRHPLLCVHLLQFHKMTTLDAVITFKGRCMTPDSIWQSDERKGLTLHHCRMPSCIDSLWATLLECVGRYKDDSQLFSTKSNRSGTTQELQSLSDTIRLNLRSDIRIKRETTIVVKDA